MGGPGEHPRFVVARAKPESEAAARTTKLATGPRGQSPSGFRASAVAESAGYDCKKALKPTARDPAGDPQPGAEAIYTAKAEPASRAGARRRIEGTCEEQQAGRAPTISAYSAPGET